MDQNLVGPGIYELGVPNAKLFESIGDLVEP
jgi:hypothetical protein